MEDYQKHLASFDAHLTLKNFSKATRSAYGCALGQFFAYREEQGIRGGFRQEQARAYILHRYKGGLKWQTINGDYSAMYKFYPEVLGLEWDVKHIPRPRKERSLPPILSQQEVQKVIECGGTFKHLKTTARYIRLCQSYQQQVRHPIVKMRITYRPTIL